MFDYLRLIYENSFYSKLFVTILVIVFANIFRLIFTMNINKYITNYKTRHVYRKVVSYLISALVLIVLAFIWVDLINYGMLFSIVGAGVVIALGDVIINLFGWFYIMLQRPFEIGERVQIGSVKGDVVDISSSYTTMLEIGDWVESEQSTGRMVHVPNNHIFKYPVYNYTKGFDFIWNEIKLVVTFESDYQKAKEICLEHLNEYHDSWAKNLERKIRKAQNSYAIYYRTLTPTVYVKINDNGVELSLRYLVEPQKRRSSEHNISQKVLDDFEKSKKIDFAYPTFRMYQKQ